MQTKLINEADMLGQCRQAMYVNNFGQGLYNEYLANINDCSYFPHRPLVRQHAELPRLAFYTMQGRRLEIE